MSHPRAVRRIVALAVAFGTAFGVTACSGGSHPHPDGPASTAASGALPAPGAGPRRPNIVFVLTDDLAMNLVRYMPHVLALEKKGMTFGNYSVTDSLCCPSRASIFTGEFPHDTKIFTNRGKNGGFVKFKRLKEESHTFAAQLQAGGYRTALMGKYLNRYYASYPLPKALGVLTSPVKTYVPPGWSEWDAVGPGYSGYNYDLNHDHAVEYHGSKPDDYLTSVVQKHAVSFISDSAAAKNPFMLEVATFSPHLPATPAPQDVGTFKNVKAPRTAAFDRLPQHAPRWLRVRAPLTPENIRVIDAEFRKRVEAVQSIDRMIGTLEQTLAKTGQADNTVFVFSSDNGFHMGEHRLDPGKLTAFDTDIHVPLVVSGPNIPAGAVSNDVVQNVDLAPTFEELGRVAAPKQTDGHSLVPLLHAKHPAWRTIALVEHRGPIEGPGDPDLQSFAQGNPPTYVALRGPRYTYVSYADGEREYYNRRTDPEELNNIYDRLSSARVATLDQHVRALESCHGQTACWAAGRPNGI